MGYFSYIRWRAELFKFRCSGCGDVAHVAGSPSCGGAVTQIFGGEIPALMGPGGHRKTKFAQGERKGLQLVHLLFAALAA